ncbi:MAG: TonB-dependent receptor [Chitinophagales bacterium]
MKYIFLILLSALYYAAAAQQQISGTVLDAQDNQPLSGAVVSLPELKTGVVTDTSGSFLITNLPKGTFTCQVSFLGYEIESQRISIPLNSPLTFTLNHSHKEMEEIVVTGTSKTSSLKESPVPTSIINREELFHISSSNIVDAITQQPGVAAVSTGGAISKPVIRGLSYNRILTLNNGVRQEGQQWGDEHGIEIDEYSIAQVELVKGPGSLMYGSDAMGGVINFLRPSPVPQNHIESDLTTEYQSNNHLFGWSLYNGGTKGRITWQARVSNRYAGNMRNRYDNYIFNSGFKEWNGNGLLGFNHKMGYTHIYLSSFNTQIGFNEGERDSLGNWLMEDGSAVSQKEAAVYKTALPFQRINHQMVTLKNHLYFNNQTSLEFTAAYQNNLRREFAESAKEAGLYLMLHTLNYDVKFHLPEKKNWETTVGLNGMWQLNKNYGTEFLIPSYNQTDGGAFIVTKKRWQKITLSGGVRADIRLMNSNALWLDSAEQVVPENTSLASQKFAAMHKLFASATGSVGVAFNPVNGLAIKLNAGSGYRTPTVAELAANGVHEGTVRYEIGNSSLKPEYSLQGDFGINFSNAHVSFDVAGFANYVQRFTYAVKLPSSTGLDSFPITGEPFVAFTFRQNDALLYGAEVELDIHPHPIDWLHLESSFSYVRGIQLNTIPALRNLSFMPAGRWLCTVRAEAHKLGPVFTHAYASIQSDFNMKQNFVLQYANTETPTARYWLLNASVGTNVGLKGKTWFTLQCSVNNILNTAYQNHLSRWKYNGENPLTGRTGIYNMGRNFTIKLIVPLYNQ